MLCILLACGLPYMWCQGDRKEMGVKILNTGQGSLSLFKTLWTLLVGILGPLPPAPNPLQALFPPQASMCSRGAGSLPTCHTFSSEIPSLLVSSH